MKRQGIPGSFRKDLSAVQKLKEKLDAADAVVIGAGAGLSASAGFTYDGERFQKYFSDFGEKDYFIITTNVDHCSSAVNPAVRKLSKMKRRSARWWSVRKICGSRKICCPFVRTVGSR